jgi:hypothetical protein
MKTAFVLVSDSAYFSKATVTIQDLRSMGKWDGDIILIALDELVLEEGYKREYNVQETKFPSINKTYLLEQIGPSGFTNSDKRELYKLNQWEKLHVFDDYFMQWDRVVFLDAGLRVLDNVHESLLGLDCRGKLLAPIDGAQLYDRPQDIFRHQLDFENKEILERLLTDFGEKIMDSNHMLNCMWMYDTSLIHRCNKQRLIDAMNRYPICRTNEMGIMNLVFHFEMGVWERLPAIASNGKFLFEWCELNNFFPTTWRNYCFLKYPLSINIL